MTLQFLVDTDVISASIARQPDPQIVRNLGRYSSACALGSPTWHELNYGVRRLPAGKKRTALAAYINEVLGTAFPILAYDERAARWHARERARLERLGKSAPFVDGQIAAITYTNGLVLVTRNGHDYENFQHLILEAWK